MKINKNTKFLIIGLGLMGGSYARALTKKGYTVNAITKDQSSIDFAIENKNLRFYIANCELACYHMAIIRERQGGPCVEVVYFSKRTA